jgi:periplasmic protein TonB
MNRPATYRRVSGLLASIACAGLAACATPAPAVEEAASPAPAALASSAPNACPAKTETLYSPQLPSPGFVPAPPRGAKVATPQRLHSAEPAYPVASQRCHEEGKVAISYCVSAEGRVENVQVVRSSGFARLDNAVLLWASRETHTPGAVNGRGHRYCGLSLEEAFDYKDEAGGEARAVPPAG